jgi:hypothetical protein
MIDLSKASIVNRTSYFILGVLMAGDNDLDEALREIVVLQLQCSAVRLVGEEYESCVRQRGHEGEHRNLAGDLWKD